MKENIVQKLTSKDDKYACAFTDRIVAESHDTDDKVYLFTYSESKTLSDDIRGCGINWWLRSPGKKQSDAVYILGRSANLMGNDVHYSLGVRPVIKVRYSE